MSFETAFVAALLAPLFRVLVMEPVFWLVRRFAPPSWMKVLFHNIPGD